MNVPMVSTNKFHYHSGEKLFTQEISSLGNFSFGQIYPDACDEGFILVSHKTGAKITLYVSKCDMDGIEILGWHLKPTPESVKKNPRISGIRMLIIND